MPTRTWIGGGNNEASNPNDWSLAGIPQAGDTLLMPNGGTMSIRGNDLAGDTLQLGNTSFMAGPPITLNLSQDAQVSLAQIGFTPINTTINVAGHDTLSYLGTGTPSASMVAVSLQPHAALTANFHNLVSGELTVNGGPGSELINQDTHLSGTHAVINVDVLGIGSIYVNNYSSQGGFLEFGGSVSTGQTVTVMTGRSDAESNLQIDKPQEFDASVIMAASRIDLVGLMDATSYSYANDMLSIYSGDRLIDRMQLTNNGSILDGQPHALQVSTSGHDVWLTQAGFANRASVPPAGSTLLPLHSNSI